MCISYYAQLGHVEFGLANTDAAVHALRAAFRFDQNDVESCVLAADVASGIARRPSVSQTSRDDEIARSQQRKLYAPCVRRATHAVQRHAHNPEVAAKAMLVLRALSQALQV